MNPRYITHIRDIPEMGLEEKEALEKVEEWFAFRSNEYYLSLIDWNYPDDPIRRLIIPDLCELEEWGEMDPSSEDKYTQVPGLQHKYRETALMLVSDMCGGFCRYCFRKRLFVNDDSEVARDISPGIEYIREHPEITNVLLTGGDPLILSSSRLAPILREIRSIDHVGIIRIGTKMPAFNPYRITGDPDLLELIQKYSTPEKRIYIMAQFTHPRELTHAAKDAVALLFDAGAVVMNQTPLIRGINDKSAVLSDLFRELSFMGVHSYYVFQCRPSAGNRAFSVPVEESFGIFEEARTSCSGLAKRARFVMSHKKGKVEVVGMDDERIYFKYNQAAEPENLGKFFSCVRNPDAHWLDDYQLKKERG